MKKLVLLSLVFAVTSTGFCQRIKKDDFTILKQKEDSLKEYAVNLIQGRSDLDRFNADSIFTRMLVRSLKVNNSFYYPFDSLQTISKLYAPDSSFRIFTWQLIINENIVRQHGAIQMRTANGSVKLYPLIDRSDITINLADTFANNLGWIGAVYYKIIETKNGNHNYYTLLGYDENNIRSNRKIIEVLNFSNDEPVFGGRYFSFQDDSLSKSPVSRYIMEFKKDAGARLTYDEDLDMIVFEHLESESNEPKKKWTLIPDGDYEGFKWKNGKWVHIEKVFNQVTPEGKEPVPNPVKDTQGNTLEENLQENRPGEVAPAEKTTRTKTDPKTKPKKVIAKKKVNG